MTPPMRATPLRATIVARVVKIRPRLIEPAVRSNGEAMPSKDDVIPGLDLDDAIRTHAGLCDHVADLIEGKAKRKSDLNSVSSDSQCLLGKWIHGRATLRYARLPEFEALRDSHAQLHFCAANVLKIQRDGDRDAARSERDRTLRPAADTFRGDIDRFCAVAAQFNAQAKAQAALSSAKISRRSAATRAGLILAASLGSAVLSRLFLFADDAAVPKAQLRLPDVVVALALGCPALYFLVLRPLYAALDRLGQVQADFRSADAAIETLSPMLVTDSNGMITRVNRAFTEVTGFSAADLEGRTPRVLKSSRQDAAFFAAMWAGLASAGSWQGRVWNKRKDGGEFLADLKITAVRGAAGELLNYVSVFTDMTEGRAGLLATETAGRGESSAQLRAEFLAHMGHELRTPMNAMMGYTDLALAEPLSDAGRKYLGQVRESGRLLLSKIDDILDLSKIEFGNLVLEQFAFDPAAVFAAAGRNGVVLATTKNLRLVSDIDSALPASVLGDPGRTAQVVDILLNNAIKFTDSGTVTVAVKLHRLGQGGANIGIMVTDTGIGMDEAQVSRLFMPFAESERSAKRRQGGAGLGLTIAKSLVDQMDGTIAVESAPGTGSSFHVVLNFPLSGEKSGPAGKSTSTPIAGWEDIPAGRYAGKRVLVAEDDPDNQGLIRVVMERFGFSVDIANNGREAVRKFGESAGAYDLVLMDIRMPEMDGLEAARLIRARSPMADLPIVALSANAFGEDRQKSLNAGMNEHLVKPVRPDQLNEVLERVLG